MLNSTTVLPSSYYRSSAPLQPPPSHRFLGRPRSTPQTEQGEKKRKANDPPALSHRPLHPPPLLGIPTPAPTSGKFNFAPAQAPPTRSQSAVPTTQTRPPNEPFVRAPPPSSSAPPSTSTPLPPSNPNLHGPTYHKPSYRPPNASEIPIPERTLHLPPANDQAAAEKRKGKWDFASAPQLPSPSLLRVDGLTTRTLPPLPPLREELFDTVFTHTSYACMKKQPFEEPEGNAMMDYERLEHLGDAVLGSCITEMIMSIFPKITPGAASLLKANLVNNKNALSSISACYHLHTKLRASPAQLYSLKFQTSVRAELFEAYLAAVFKQYGYSMAKLWINDLFSPIAIAGYESLMNLLPESKLIRQPHSSNAQAKLNPSAEGENVNIGFSALLNQWCLQNKRTLEYLEGPEESTEKVKLYVFKLFIEKEGVRQKDGSVPEWGWHEYGPSWGSQKKIIKNNLAAQACHSLGIVAEIE